MPSVDDEPIVFSARVRVPSPVTLSVVVPLFNEEESLAELHRRLTAALAVVEYELVFVNDGSTDRTRPMLETLARTDERVRPLHLTRNFGHQSAVTAGLEHARGDCVAVLDGDLQDPPEVLPALLERWREGFDVVYAVRTKRKEGWVKRFGYFAFYRLLRATADLDIPLDAGDFCLMDRAAVDALNSLPERRRFVRGLRTFIGFRQTGLSYERDPRFAGTPKYTLGKLAALAADGAINFSTLPVRAVGWVAAGLLAGGLMGLLTLACQWFGGAEPAGWVVVIAAAVALAGVQAGCVWVVGLYSLTIFAEVKRRPSYIVEPPPSARSRSREFAPPESFERSGQGRDPLAVRAAHSARVGAVSVDEADGG
ncbi:MAG: glycosyltransferase family 2 protein [Fimbriiglobus sp.]|jgi:dolichol-phosphate mannosyltransferase|nr:glycosyltransferase family 2 protein [Fimbriiglobus sp.]